MNMSSEVLSKLIWLKCFGPIDYLLEIIWFVS